MPMNAVQFERSVDRHLVHRAAVAGVFLTSIRERPTHQDWVFGVQLPRSEAREDGTLHPRLRLLGGIEAMRQSTLATAHQGFDVPHGWAFTMQRLSFGWVDDAPRFPTFGPISAAGRIEIVDHATRHGVTSGLNVRFHLLDEEGEVGAGTGELRCIPPGVYRRVRGQSQPRVDRWDDSPVQNAVGSREALRGNVGWNVGDAGVFDHDNDHLPGVAILDCAIIAAELVTERVARRVEMSFDTFTEYSPPPKFAAHVVAPPTVAFRVEQMATTTASGRIDVR